MPSKKGKASSVTIGLRTDGEVHFDKGVVAESSIPSIQQYPSLLRKCQKVYINLESSMYKVLYQS